MDSLSQIVLGGAVAAAIAPARHRRAALLAGAMLGTLPDLDSLPLALLTDDPVARDDYGPYTPGFVAVPYGDVAALALFLLFAHTLQPLATAQAATNGHLVICSAIGAEPPKE